MAQTAKWTPRERHNWADLIAHLDDALSPDLPVAVRRIRMADDGKIERHSGSYTVLIQSSISYAHAVDALLHEWAHALADIRGNADLLDHNDLWGIAYATVYREFLRWNKEP